MTDPQRLRRLREANFRAKQQHACRICGGVAFVDKPYCYRHYRMLKDELKGMAARGERLEEIDAVLTFRQRFKSVTWYPTGVLMIGHSMTLRKSNDEWVLRKSTDAGEIELGRFALVKDVYDYVLQQSATFSTHNPHATKMLIR